MQSTAATRAVLATVIVALATPDVAQIKSTHNES